MQIIQPLEDERNRMQTERLFDVAPALGLTSHMMKTMAESPAALEGYLNLSGALANGELGLQFREKIALTVAQANGCQYSLAAHACLGRRAGLSEEEILESREARDVEPRTDTALKFVRSLVLGRGDAGLGQLRRMREAGFVDREMVEIVGLVALNIFGNYFHKVAGAKPNHPQAGARIQAA